MGIQFSRFWAMPSADTFDCEPIKGFVQKYLLKSKVSIDPFARNKRWATHTNDLNPDTAAEHHYEAFEFLNIMKQKGVKTDLVIFDPPYSIRQCKEVYDSVGLKVTQRDCQVWGHWGDYKEVINDLLLPYGVVLHFGWHSNGMGIERGFEIIDLLLVAHGRAHNDTICIAEKRKEPSPTFLF